jgi:hypothetical protein
MIILSIFGKVFMNISRTVSNALSILCVIALVCIGFAHRPVITSPTSPIIDLSEYALPDGTIPVICFGGQGDGKTTTSQGCEYCTLASSVILPERPHLFARTAIGIRFIGPAHKNPAISKSIRLAGAPPTGPPALSI